MLSEKLCKKSYNNKLTNLVVAGKMQIKNILHKFKHKIAIASENMEKSIATPNLTVKISGRVSSLN